MGIEVVPNDQGLILSQRRYILELLNRANMTATKLVITHLPTTAQLTSQSGTPLDNATEYRAMFGSLQYLLITRPDIAFVVNRLSQYMHCPIIDHWTCVKRFLQYLVGTVNEGLQLYYHFSTNIHAFSNAD